MVHVYAMRVILVIAVSTLRTLTKDKVHTEICMTVYLYNFS